MKQNQKQIIKKTNNYLFWITGITFLIALLMTIISLFMGNSQNASNFAIVSILMGLINKGVRDK